MRRVRGYGQGFAYFVRCDLTGLVKIGWSQEPERRLLQLQGWSPTPLRLVARAPGTLATERRLHSAMAAHRVHGEWFRLDDALVAEAIEFVRAASEETPAELRRGAPPRGRRCASTPLRTWRRSSGLTFEDLAERAAVSLSTVKRAAAGQAVDDVSAASLAAVTGIDAAQLRQGVQR